MKALLAFEWQRLKSSFVLSLLLGVVIVGVGALFWMANVRQTQTLQGMRKQVTAKQERLRDASGAWQYVVSHPDESTAAEIAEAKRKIALANQLLKTYQHQSQALRQRNSPRYFKTSLKTFKQEKKLNQMSPVDFTVDFGENRVQTVTFKKLLSARQGYEVNGSSTMTAVFMTDLSRLLSNWFVIFLVVMISSTTWALSWFNHQHQWVRLNIAHEGTWLGANLIVVMIIWLGMLLLALALGWLLSRVWGQPLLSGSHGWQNTATDSPQSLIHLFSTSLQEAVWRFGLVYLIWQLISRSAPKFRR